MEEINVSDKLQHYLELFEEVRKKVTDEASAVAILQEIGKDGRVARMHGFSRPSSIATGDIDNELSVGRDVPATSKQLGFLRSLGVGFNTGLTKQEASRLIDEAQSNRVIAG